MKQILLFASLFAISCNSNLTVNIENKTSLNREDESITVEWTEVVGKLGEIKGQDVVVTNSNGTEISSQLLYEGEEKPTAILFQADIAPNSSANYMVKKGTPQNYDTLTYGRFVPERLDDFTWENNKIAYRMYGPALEATGEVSNGIDIWLKRTPKMVINKWYKKGYNYHADSGEGLDCYKVGRTLGAGANAPILGDSLVLSNNFTAYKILDSGVLRTKIELSYAPFMVDGVEVTQKRTITLDANQNLNTITTVYSGDFEKLDIASGIVTLNAEGENIEMDEKHIAYAQPASEKNGTTYAAVITKDNGKSIRIGNHILKYSQVKSGEPYTYQAGGYWSKYGINDYNHWKEALHNATEKFNTDLIITIQ